jgi:UDP-perosamine 4-acetyltransferase
LAVTARILCFGAGGHACVVLDSLEMQGGSADLEIVGLVANEPVGSEILGVPVVGPDEALTAIIGTTKASHFVVGIGTVRGGDMLRERLFRIGREAGLEPFTFVHPSATVARSAVLGAGAQIMAGAIVQPRTMVGGNVIVNTGARIDHDCRVGDHAHIAPGVTCSGGVTIGARTHIGAGATILQNLTIGSDATVGAGATVIRDCPSGATVVGTPAR